MQTHLRPFALAADRSGPQFPPPSYERGMNQLASIPDTGVAGRGPRRDVPRSAVGRITPATGAARKPAAGAGDQGFGFGPRPCENKI
jgi:hypothetical protein